MKNLRKKSEPNIQWFKFSGDQSGLGLIEVMFACMIMLIGIVPMMSLLALAISQNENAANKSVATNLARSTLEEIYQQDYDSIVSYENTYGIMKGLEDYRRVVLVSDNTPIPGMKTIRVAILWKTADNRESTRDGLRFNPAYPNMHPPLVELFTTKSLY